MYSSKLSERQNRTAQKKRSLAAAAAASDTLAAPNGRGVTPVLFQLWQNAVLPEQLL